MATRGKATTKALPKYAAGTEVSVEKSQIEIQKLLKRYGAVNAAYGEQGDLCVILFTIRGRQYRMQFTYPPVEQFRKDARGQRRTAAQAETSLAQEKRRLWRALFMVVKAKLEAVASGIVTFEEEFLAHTVLANNQTVAEYVDAQLASQQIKLLPQAAQARADEIPDIVIDL